MAWMLVNPQIHNTFASLGTQQGETYKVNSDCLAILDDILNNLVIEDRTLRTFRRAIGFGQYIRKDLLPLLINVKDDNNIVNASKIIDTTIKILVNLTIPVECLISTDALSRTPTGRHTIFEINKMLLSSKEAFVDTKSTKAVLDHILYFIERGTKLEVEQCDSINNCLLLLRNILHIPENRIMNCPLAHNSMQNQILWNLFTQSVDKILIHLMSCPQKIYWVVSMVQLIALMYKDQHVGTLQKLLNMWFESSLSDSSDDNESNTSPPNQNSGDSSSMITSDPTSDSSDNGGRKKRNDTRPHNDDKSNNTPHIKQHVVRSIQNRNKILLSQKNLSQKMSDLDSNTSTQTSDSKKEDTHNHQAMLHTHNMIRARKRKRGVAVNWINLRLLSGAASTSTSGSNTNYSNIKKQGSLQSEFSDYGYGTQVENQESISTSSNDDEFPTKKPVHQKPHMVQKPRLNKQRPPQDKKEERRKKLIKRSKTHMINMKGLTHHSPTDENISNILKEFTVDFLLKGYGSLVQDLFIQLLGNFHLQIDTSHFFWLVTYFLKFATQLELDFEHISPVLSINILSYLTFEGISLCEQLGINETKSEIDLKPYLRRTHLVVTAIREYLQAVNVYKKLPHLSPADRETITKLQLQITSMDDFINLFLLLLRQYNPVLQSKQYLQDLITTNHILMLFLDDVSKLSQYKGTDKLMQHLKQFATVEVMHKYGLLLEEFENNGKFVNDCIFTMMHHIGGDLDNIAALFQPHILKTFSKIWESDYEICDDWSDLIEYVIHKFINVPRSSEDRSPSTSTPKPRPIMPLVFSVSTTQQCDEWTTDEIDALNWYYMGNQNSEHLIDNIMKSFNDQGVVGKTRISIMKQLLKQHLINHEKYDELIKSESCEENMMDNSLPRDENQDFKTLKEQLVKENLGNSVLWLQKILIETCYCKIVVANKELFKDCETVAEPIPYCYTMLQQSVPLVPWNEEQWNILNVRSFILLLHKLGFHLPADTGKMFVRIPNFWTADYIFNLAQKLGPIDIDSLKFDVNLLPATERVIVPVQNDNHFEITEVWNSTILPTYTPMLKSTSDWFDTVLQAKSTNLSEAVRDVPRNINEPLAISIPDIVVIPCALPAPHLSVMEEVDKPINSEKCLLDSADCNKITLPVNDDCEHNSIEDTASVASDLTRMYVSDEEKDVL